MAMNFKRRVQDDATLPVRLEKEEKDAQAKLSLLMSLHGEQRREAQQNLGGFFKTLATWAEEIEQTERECNEKEEI